MPKININNFSLSSIDINDEIINKLNNNNIYCVKDLCNLNRKKLKDYGLSLDEINHVIIKLQLQGFDLSKKKYCNLKKGVYYE